MCAALNPLQTFPLSGGRFSFSPRPSRAFMRCLCRPPGPAFLSLPLFCPSALPHPYTERKLEFLSSRFQLSLDSSTAAPHGPNRAGNPFFWCRFPTLASKSQTGSHTGFSLFCSVSLPTFPLRGKAGLFSNLGYPDFARLAHNCPTRLQQGG